MLGRWVLVVLGLVAWVGGALFPLRKEKLGSKYEIGTIQRLHYKKDRLFFLSDDDLFGHIGLADGELLEVFELELGEHIVNFAHAMEVVIARAQKLNIFWPQKGSYYRTYETKFLARHPDFATIIAYHRSRNGPYVLTDKFLLFIPHVISGTRLEDVKEKLVLQFTDPKETPFNLVSVINPKEKRMEDYLATLLADGKATQVCFHNYMAEKVERNCVQLQEGEVVEDIVGSGSFLFIELEQGVVVLEPNLQVVERLEGAAVQYFAGMVTIGDDHQSYAPFSRKRHDVRVIENWGSGRTGFMGLKVEDSLLTVLNLSANSNSSVPEALIAIPKNPEDTPRKAWSISEDNGDFNLLVEFEEGRLVSYRIDAATKNFAQAWEFATMQADKQAEGEIEAKEDEDLEDAETEQEERERIEEVENHERADINEQLKPAGQDKPPAGQDKPPARL